MVSIQDVKAYRDSLSSEYKDRMELAEENANDAETQDDNRYWTGYADAISDAMDVVDKFFELFINDDESNNEDLNK